jgi:hypothetical protein
MKGMWIKPNGASGRSSRGPRWSCQLMHVDLDDDGLIFDLVALEPSPTSGSVVPVGTPFSLHVSGGTGPVAASAFGHVARWAARADVVTLAGGLGTGSRWLCLSSGDTDLVVELSDPE